MIDVSRRRAFSRVEIATSAKCSRLVPYRCMCRWASTANIWPGPTRPAGWMKLPSGVGGAAYCAPEARFFGANDAPNRLTACWSDMRLTTHVAMPDAMAAAARPTDPAAPPPPPVSMAVKRTSGIPITCAKSEVSPPRPNEYSASPSTSSTVRPASSSAASIALPASSNGVCGSERPRL